MSTHRQPRRTAAPSYPDATPVGDHLVIDAVEWVPGFDPETRPRENGQRRYAESYYRCLRCEVECLRKADFPQTCEPVADERHTHTGDSSTASTAEQS